MNSAFSNLWQSKCCTCCAIASAALSEKLSFWHLPFRHFCTVFHSFYQNGCKHCGLIKNVRLIAIRLCERQHRFTQYKINPRHAACSKGNTIKIFIFIWTALYLLLYKAFAGLSAFSFFLSFLSISSPSLSCNKEAGAMAAPTAPIVILLRNERCLLSFILQIFRFKDYAAKRLLFIFQTALILYIIK